jgi:hypothetical protein
MTYKYRAGDQAKLDTGIGLIFRLAELLRDVEQYIKVGDVDNWDVALNRIFNNCMYRAKPELVRNAENKIIAINFNDEDLEIFSFFNSNIKNIKQKMNIAKQREDLLTLQRERNNLITEMNNKDIWIRIKMFRMELYLREYQFDPKRAVFGG